MYKYIRCLCLFLLLIPLSCGKIPGIAKEDTPANREESVKKYLKVISPEDVIRDMAANLALNLPEADRPMFLDMMIKNMDINKIEDIMIRAMVKNFTVKEIDAMTAFYGTPEGKSTMKKFGTYMADIMPDLQKEVYKSAIKSMPRR